MNKRELVEKIANESGHTKAITSSILDSLMDTVKKELKSGGSVELTGFGSFVVGYRAPREGRNPQTGEKINIQGTKFPKFKAGKSLKEAVQDALEEA